MERTKQMKINELKHTFLEELASWYDAKKQLIRELPKMAKTAPCYELRKMIQSHLKETYCHVQKLETVFKSFDSQVKEMRREALAGVRKNGDRMNASFRSDQGFNNVGRSASKKIAPFKNESLGRGSERAVILENNETNGLLRRMLAEEKAASQALTALTHTRGAAAALAEGDGMDSVGESKTAGSLFVRRGLLPLDFHQSSAVMR